MRSIYTSLAVLLVAGPVVAQMPTAPDGPKPLLKLPPSVKVAPGKLARVVPETTAKQVTWRVPANVDAELVNGGLLVVCTAPVGTYTLTAAVPGPDGAVTFADVSLVVGGDVPPPDPADPFTAELKRLAGSDTSPDRVENAKKLAALYRQAAKLTGDATIATAGELMDAVSRAAASFTADVLRPVRDRVVAELRSAAKFDADAVLTPELRSKLASVYSRAAAALESP